MSVTPLMAETTTTARSHTTSCSRAISASAAIAVAFPTDVPPNFMTKRDILNPFICSVIELWRRHRRDVWYFFSFVGRFSPGRAKNDRNYSESMSDGGWGPQAPAESPCSRRVGGFATHTARRELFFEGA